MKLKALTSEARRALGRHYVAIKQFPFFIGRDRRVSTWRIPLFKDRRVNRKDPINKVYLRESTDTHYISREHFFLDWRDDELFLVDQGSTCGTIVQGKKVGGHRARGECPLGDCAVIRVGGLTSPYRFLVLIKLGAKN